MDDAPLVDSHLDLAENATLFGDDQILSVAKMRAPEGHAKGQATVSQTRARRIAVAFAGVTAGLLAKDVGEALGEMVARGELSTSEVEAAGEGVLRGNAKRLDGWLPPRRSLLPLPEGSCRIC